MNRQITNHYAVLGLQLLQGTDEQIKNAYRKRAREWHPDLHPEVHDGLELMKLANAAYDVLSDPSKRAAYDQMVRAIVYDAQRRSWEPRQEVYSGSSGANTMYCGVTFTWG